jgi:hypothetical protein
MLFAVVFLILTIIKRNFRKKCSVSKLFGQSEGMDEDYEYEENLPSYTQTLKKWQKWKMKREH